MSINKDVRSKTGRKTDEITIENILNGSITNEDVKISAETLLLQAETAKNAGRRELGGNFMRAGELTRVPDNELLSMYEKLRPHRSTKQELLDTAIILEERYNASQCAKLFRDAAEVYEKRGVLRD